MNAERLAAQRAHRRAAAAKAAADANVVSAVDQRRRVDQQRRASVRLSQPPSVTQARLEAKARHYAERPSVAERFGRSGGGSISGPRSPKKASPARVRTQEESSKRLSSPVKSVFSDMTLADITGPHEPPGGLLPPRTPRRRESAAAREDAGLSPFRRETVNVGTKGATPVKTKTFEVGGDEQAHGPHGEVTRGGSTQKKSSAQMMRSRRHSSAKKASERADHSNPRSRKAARARLRASQAELDSMKKQTKGAWQ